MGKSTAKKHKALKVILIVLAVMVVLCIGGFFIAATHTQIVVDFIQKMADNGKPLNSYGPLNEPQNGLKENGQYLISEIEYAKDYPNSFLDIIYPDENREAVKVLHEIKRILRPNGRLILAYNSMYARAVHKSDPTKGMYDDAGIEKAVTGSGMKIQSRKPCGMGQAVFVISHILPPSE